MAFREDGEGQVAAMLSPQANWRIPWYENAAFQLWLIAFFSMAFLSTLIWPAAYVWRTMVKKRLRNIQLGGVARLLAGLTGALNVIFLIGFAFALQSYPNLIWYGVPEGLTILLVIPCLTAALTVELLGLGLTWVVWRNEYWSFFHRFHYSVVVLSSLAFMGFLLYWNLFGIPLLIHLRPPLTVVQLAKTVAAPVAESSGNRDRGS